MRPSLFKSYYVLNPSKSELTIDFELKENYAPEKSI